MKTVLCRLFVLVLLPASLFADRLKPYILAGTEAGTRQEVQSRTELRLTSAGFKVVGQYSPSGAESLAVLCVTTDALKAAVAQAGGLRGFAAVLRVGLSQTDAGVQVSYTNPVYWGNAYFEKDYPAVESTYRVLADQFKTALAGLPEAAFEAFGSKKGLTAKKLQKYHYMMAMPYFDDVQVLDKGSSFADATARIEARAAAADSEVEIVYSIQFSDQKMALYGTALKGEKGESKFLPKIDKDDPRHAAFLPYELLVLEDKVVSLHGKYRIALSFPDLGMGTFMKISSAPGDIADAQRALAEQ